MFKTYLITAFFYYTFMIYVTINVVKIRIDLISENSSSLVLKL